LHPDTKIERLKAILQTYERVAIAFSGGTDSSLLVKFALDTLGAGNVLVLFGASELLTAREIARASQWPAKHGYERGIEMEILQLQPLGWKEFVNNAEDRCYFCKFRIYSLFRERMEKRGFSVLADGTNTDDLKSHRAGLRAIHELGAKTPLVEAGFDKAEVRLLSQRLHLESWNQPSSSCLATRIPTGMKITAARLRRIEAWEEGLERFGFTGCRARMGSESEDTVRLEIARKDFEVILDPGIRLAIQRFFQSSGVRKVLLDLEGR
jgi:uncharacterized protein